MKSAGTLFRSRRIPFSVFQFVRPIGVRRDKLSGTKFSFPGIGNSRELSAIPGKFTGIAKSTKILGISRGWTMIYAFNWTNMKNTGYHYVFASVWVNFLTFSNFY